MFYDIECPVERFEHLLSSISVIVLVIVMMHPNQLSAMTNPNGQAVFSPEYPINYELPPPYCVNEGGYANANDECVNEGDCANANDECVNEGDCVNANNETQAAQFQDSIFV